MQHTAAGFLCSTVILAIARPGLCEAALPHQPACPSLHRLESQPVTGNCTPQHAAQTRPHPHFIWPAPPCSPGHKLCSKPGTSPSMLWTSLTSRSCQEHRVVGCTGHTLQHTVGWLSKLSGLGGSVRCTLLSWNSRSAGTVLASSAEHASGTGPGGLAAASLPLLPPVPWTWRGLQAQSGTAGDTAHPMAWVAGTV